MHHSIKVSARDTLSCNFYAMNYQLNLFILLMLMFHGLSHGSMINQAGLLTAFRHAKMKSQGDNVEWITMMISTFDEELDDIGKMEDDLIAEGLPGQPSGAKFKQYAGYINVDKSKGRNLFYYFTEAVDNSSSKPLILWLNGAPDAYTFLVNWFKRFPQYTTTKDFYIIGESYAGFYIPELAEVIIKTNMDKNSTPKIQLKGIMVGNGIMNDATDNKGSFDYMWSHAMISDETYQGLMQYCTTPNFNRTKCDVIQYAVDNEVGNIDFYNIYGPVCSHSSNPSRKSKCSGGYDPCEISYVRNYLNLPEVQESLHANRTKLPYAWDSCSEMVHEYWKDSPSSMFPIYRSLIASGLRIIFYSGDLDAVLVPVTSTRYSINALNLKVIKPWHFWLDDTGEVGGYQNVYQGLTFSTVRGAGHEVPRVQPRRSLSLLNKFIGNLH